MIWILVACSGVPAIELDRPSADSPPELDELDTGGELDTDTGGELDTGDECPDGPPVVTGIALACDGPELAAWWTLAGAAVDVRVTWSAADGSSYAKTWSAAELDGSTCCGSAVADTWQGCGELDGITLRVESLDDDGARVACAEIGAAPSGACAVVDPPECQ